MCKKFQGPEGKAASSNTIGFEGIRSKEIPVGKTWTPIGVLDSQIIDGVNDYRTLAKIKLEQNR